MSNINLKRFVDINIQAHVASISDGTRETIVLFTDELEELGQSGSSVEVSSMSEANTAFSDQVRFASTLSYLSIFFANGGIKVKVIKGIPIASLTKSMIMELDEKYICIAFASANENETAVYAKLKSLAMELDSDANVYGINEKILFARTSNEVDDSQIKNFVAKYSTILGAEMTICAYLSKIDVYGINSIFDYAFTQENIEQTLIDDNTFETVMNNNMNVDIYLANAVRNCGGNCKDGQDIVNNFVRIVLHQTLTDRLVTLLSQKIKGSSGISKIYSVISQELEKYLTSGYLTTDKIWSDESLKINYNAKQFTIIEKGTPLTNGYYVSILPLSAMSTSDKQSHKCPPIYIILADQYSIRQIVINGEVI